ncbi:MAG: hypothetical protein LBK72_09925, partial [Bifidobacteriaceae bacterium]|nr:hypothetical protein [Bifidobacteriaceae bacterium]
MFTSSSLRSVRGVSALACVVGLAAAGGLAISRPAGAEAPDGRAVSPQGLISAGSHFSMAVDADGQVWGWGSQDVGVLGNAIGSGKTATPVQALGIDGRVRIVEAGTSHAVALTADGYVWNWGDNDEHALGANAEGMDFSGLPVRVPELEEIVDVAAGESVSFAVTAGGDVYGWGSGEYYMLGPEEESSITPVLRAGLENIVSVDVGENHAAAVTGDGQVWVWGVADNAGLGDEEWKDAPTPFRVEDLPTITAVSCGDDYTVAVDDTGGVWAWGRNGNGQVGVDVEYGEVQEPVPVDGLSGVVEISAGNDGVTVVTRTGEVWTWGRNGDGRLGRNGLVSSHVPGRVDLLVEAVAVSTSNSHTMVLDADGKVHTWGQNEFYELGDTTRAGGVITPTAVPGMTGVASVAAAENSMLARTSDGEVYMWGAGPLGNGTSDPSYTPVLADLPGPATKAVAAKGTYTHMLAIVDGDVYTWGNNSYGQSGVPLPEGHQCNFVNWIYTPVLVEGIEGEVVDIAATHGLSVAVTADGAVWTWGDNSYGQLGNGTKNDQGCRHQPGKVDGLDVEIRAVSAGGQGYVIAAAVDGTLRSWGRNNDGQLGIEESGSSSWRGVPQTVRNISDVIQVVCGPNHVLAMVRKNQDDRIWNWGSNSRGQRGSDLNTPILSIPGVWTSGRPVGPGYLATYTVTSMLIKPDGTRMMWGENIGGVMYGDEDWLDKPAGVNEATVMADNLHAVAGDLGNLGGILLAEPDGQVYTWGMNGFGQLGYPLGAWIPQQRLLDLDLGEFSLPAPMPGTSDDPTRDPGGDPGDDPSGGGPGNPPDDSTGHLGDEQAGGGEDDVGESETDADRTSGSGDGGSGVGNDIGGGLGVNDAGLDAASTGEHTGGGVVVVPAVSRFVASFTTVVLRPGQRVTVPVAVYARAGAFVDTARVAWRASAPGTASVVKNQKAGEWSWTEGGIKAITVVAGRVGVSRIALSAPGARDLVLRVRVVAPDDERDIERLAILTRHRTAAPKRLATGESVELKAWPSPASATRVRATWSTSNPAVASVNAVGRVTAI